MFNRNDLYVFTSRFSNLFATKDYGEIGFFKKSNKQTTKYTYANWGSRRWEYFYVADQLSKIGVKNKHVVDIGIGLPTDADFYKFYIGSGCYLTGIDPDGRLKKVTKLSERCQIIRSSGDKLPLKSQSADVVVVLSAFEHFHYKTFSKTLKEINRILKNDGHLIVTLDTTSVDHTRSARWAILEKTFNGLPAEENDLPLPRKSKPLSIIQFLNLVSTYFYPKNKNIRNVQLNPDRLVYDKYWNSTVAYMHLYKKQINYGQR